MSESVLTLASLALPGAWRVACIGRLANDCAIDRYPFINVFLGKVDRERPGRLQGELHRATMPIGELPLIHLNKVIVDGAFGAGGKSPAFSFEETAWATLSTRREDLTVFDRHAEHGGEPIIPSRERWSTVDPDRDGLFVGFRQGHDPYATIIPCTEIFRFFYATSSVMAASILMGDIVDFDRTMWDAEKSCLDGGGNAYIRLRRRMLDSDARSISRFAFDEYALGAAMDIFYFNARQHPRGRERAIRALPPFEQEVACALTQVPISTGGFSRKLVTRIDSCSFAPPFRSLTWDRENDGRSDPEYRVGRDQSTRRTRQLAPSEHSDATLGVGRPSSAFHPHRITLQDERPRFPDLDAIATTKADRGDAPYASSSPLAALAPAAAMGSVVLGKTSASLLAATIVASRATRATLPRSPAERDEDTVQLPSANRRVAESLAAASAAGVVSIAYQTPFDSVFSVGSTPFCLFPEPRGSSRSSWTYLDPARTVRRAVLTARLTKASGQTRYVADIEHKVPGEMSLLVLWAADHGPVGPDVIRDALEWCADLEGAKVGDMGPMLLWGRRRHCGSDSDTIAAERFVDSIFETQPVKGGPGRGRATGPGSRLARAFHAGSEAPVRVSR